MNLVPALVAAATTITGVVGIGQVEFRGILTAKEPTLVAQTIPQVVNTGFLNPIQKPGFLEQPGFFSVLANNQINSASVNTWRVVNSNPGNKLSIMGILSL